MRARWPLWTPFAAAVWGVLYAAVQVVWVRTGVAQPLGVSPEVQLALAALAVLGAGLSLASVRVGRTVVGVPLAVVTAVFALGTFGAPIEFVSIVAGSVDTFALSHLVLDIVGAGLLLCTSLSCWRRRRGRCPRCGHTHSGGVDGSLTYPAASTASRKVRVAVLIGMCGVLPWAATKTIWTLGGDALGVTAEAWREGNAVESGWLKALASVGIDFTVLSAMLACFLMLGLTFQWGQVFPRWTLLLSGRRVPRLLPLVPAWLTGVTLSLYGTALTIASGLLLVGVGTKPEPSPPFTDSTGATWMVEFGGLAFAGLGIGLLVAARSYAVRTRPVCEFHGTVDSRSSPLDGDEHDNS